jgi:hypothetical protein
MFSLNFKKKTKIDNYVGIWGHSWYYWKAFTKFDLIMLQKCELYFEILVGIVVRNSKKLQKIRLGRKIQLNAFKLGPMT